MVTQLHALRAQQNKHLLNVDFSQREHWQPVIKQSLFTTASGRDFIKKRRTSPFELF